MEAWYPSLIVIAGGVLYVVFHTPLARYTVWFTGAAKRTPSDQERYLRLYQRAYIVLGIFLCLLGLLIPVLRSLR